jgi:hypothetical protein
LTADDDYCRSFITRYNFDGVDKIIETEGLCNGADGNVFSRHAKLPVTQKTVQTAKMLTIDTVS